MNIEILWTMLSYRIQKLQFEVVITDDGSTFAEKICQT